jgi:hypothetical protein
MMQTVAYIRVVVAVIAVVSCQSGRMYQEPLIERPVPTASGPPPPLNDDPHTTVERLSADLDARRSALGLSTPRAKADEACEPVCVVEEPPGLPTHAQACAPGAGSVCAARCTQADGACDDAAKICAIAKKEPSEAWIAGRCRDASATCSDATPLCCRCK